MLKKFFLLFVAVTAVLGLSAQHAPGSWRTLPMAGMDYNDVIDTPEKVYYLTGNSLYSYDKEADETIYYTPGTKISDSGIQSVVYNPDGKYLMCIYTNANIDLIYDNGKVVNMPEIKDANLVTEKKINDVYFDNGKIYIATTFGMVIYDDKHHAVVESSVFNEPIEKIAVLGDNIIVIKKEDKYNLYFSPKDIRHSTFDKFELIQENLGVAPMFGVSDNSYVNLVNNKFYLCTIDFANKSFNAATVFEAPGATEVQTYKNGFYVVSNNDIRIIGKDGSVGETKVIADALKNHKISFWNGFNSVWAANSQGLGNFNISSDNPTVLRDKYFPESSKQFNNCYATNSPDGSEVWFNGIGQSTYHPSTNSGGALYSNPLLLESYNWNTGEIVPRYPDNVTKQYSNDTQSFQNASKLNLLYGGPGMTLIDPVDNDLIYHANNFDGLFIIKNRQIVKHFNEKNGMLCTGWNHRVYGLTFDPFGNLWIGIWNILGNSYVSNGFTHPKCSYIILKKSGLDKLRNNIDATLSPDDWTTSAIPDSYQGRSDVKIAFTPKSNKAIHVVGSSWCGPVYGYDTKGTDTTSDDEAVVYYSFVDQDGNVTNPIYKGWVEVDKKGDFWIGTTTGVYVINDHDKITDESNQSLVAVRPKVPRNDGTNFADYLLSTEQVLCIAVDSNNNKWIGTLGSGLYYVNEDGTEIYNVYDKTNSPLVSNTITMLACNPNGNDLLIGTPEGLYVYSSDSAPAADDYSTVYAYPNPVRPDYTGWITINGLMDNSLVKITDVQGHVVWQSQSEGGMAVWDGCDTNGNRIRSGVYMVYASQNQSGDASGAVTKIVVVN